MKDIPAIFRWITVEPAVFFFALTVGLVTVANQALYVDRVCRYGSDIYGNGTTYTEVECNNLTANR